MIRHLAILLFLFITSFAGKRAFAQAEVMIKSQEQEQSIDRSRLLNFKIIYGTGVSSFSGRAFSYSPRFVWLAGVGYEVNAAGCFSLLPSVFFASRGGGKYSADYIAVPAIGLIRFRFTDKFGIVAHAGPYAAVRVSSYSNLKRFDFGTTTGAGLEYGHFFWGINYDRGFVDIAKRRKGYARSYSCMLTGAVRF